MENEIFNMARENNEMDEPDRLDGARPEATNAISSKPVSYVNQDMVDRIDKLEKQMVGGDPALDGTRKEGV